MKKLMSALLAFTLAATTLVGCGGTSAPSETSTATGTDTSTAAEQVTLKWALWDIAAVPYYQPLIDAYKEVNPNVTIEMVDLGSTDYQTQLTTQLAGGANDLDIITVKDMPCYATLVDLEMVEPLNDMNATDPSMYGGLLEQITVDGKYYALPFRSDFWVMFYNKDLFDKAGVEYPTNDMTFEEYDALARQLTSGEGSEKVYGTHHHTWRGSVQLFGILEGNTVVDGSYDFLKPAYEMILAQQNDGICMDYATLKTGTIHYSGVFFNNQVATMPMGSWFLATQIDKVKTGESLATNWGMVKFPHPEGVEAGTTPGNMTCLGINSKSANKEAAADFVNFVCGEAGAEVVAKTGTIPAIKTDAVLDAIASMEGFPTDENSKQALVTTKTYLEMPLHEKASDIETLINQAHDSIMTNNCTIDEGIAQMNESVQELLAE